MNTVQFKERIIQSEYGKKSSEKCGLHRLTELLF